MDNVYSLNRRTKITYERLSELYQLANAASSPSPDLLPTVLKELGIVSEELQVAIAELAQQSEKIGDLQREFDRERQRYQNLFEFVPDACLVTDPTSLIYEANYGAAALFNMQQPSLIHKSLSSLVFFEDLHLFQAKLSQLAHQDRVRFSVRLHRHSSDIFDAAVTIGVIRKQESKSLALQWLLEDITEHKRAEAALEIPNYDPCQDRSLHCYSKGETIPLEPQSIWLVAEGVIKLTTLSERGEKMLVGLIGDSMLLGSSLTALQTYQAIALSDVKLALVSLTEIAQSPRLAQALLPLLNQRLQQAESLLSIYGQIRVEDRLNRLLLLLKQVIGQPVDQGTRLRARLTHQDFANACCTTRVTVTRLLGKFQNSGKITQDAQNHLVLKE